MYGGFFHFVLVYEKTMRIHISILLFAVYSLVLALSDFLHVIFLAPIFLELYRLRNDVFKIFKKLITLNIFLLILAASVYISDERLALLIYLRSNLILIFGIMLFYNQTYFDIANGLKELKAPDILVSMFYFTSKFIVILKENISKFQKNLLLRGFRAKASMFTYKTYANFIGFLLIESLHKANSLNNILITRGFNGKIHSLKNSQNATFYEITLCIVTIISLTIGYLS